VLAVGFQTTLVGMVRFTWPIFKSWGPNHIFGISEDRHFKFRVLIDSKRY